MTTDTDMSNKRVFGFLSVENFIVLVVIFAGIVGTWTTYGQDIDLLKDTDKAQSQQIEKIKSDQAAIKEAVTETKLDVREIKTNQEHLNRDVQRILMILEDRNND